MHILDKIVNHKITEVAKRKQKTSITELEASDYFNRTTHSLSESLQNSPTGIISEFKRRSPSKPTINLDANLSQIVTHYTQAGVSGISILTDEHFFGGHHSDLTDARRIVDTPLLRKEFIIDEYQIIEAKSIGADAILLITEILTVGQVKSFASLAKSIGLDTLLEIHSIEQLDKYNSDIDIVGVNNRDLTQFTVDPMHSVRLYEHLPSEVTKISESGIHNPETILTLKETGFDGFLIGERFMKTMDPGKACRDFIQDLNDRI